MDDPRTLDFANGLDNINAIAETSDGFVWRLKDDDGGNNATSIHAYDDDLMIVNMSVWRTVEDLHSFVYRSQHTDFLKRRKEWFSVFESAYYVLWWIPAGHTPTIDEAKERLEYFNNYGESEVAFSFKIPVIAPASADDYETRYQIAGNKQPEKILPENFTIAK